MSLPIRPVESGLTLVAVAHFHGSNDATAVEYSSAKI